MTQNESHLRAHEIRFLFEGRINNMTPVNETKSLYRQKERIK